MKCPKCGYLGFEQVDRCRNCGYEFSLAKPERDPDLSLNDRSAEHVGPLDELSFLKEAARPADRGPTPSDLPLFTSPAVDDMPLITKASPPRTPLAVRRATPEVPRLRSEPRPQSFDLAFDPDDLPPAESAGPSPAIRSRSSAARALAARQVAGTVPQDAGLLMRGMATIADVMILAIVDVFVVYFTMQICGIGVIDLAILPKAPMLTFFVVQNGGYLVAFTAGGQTLGKMMMGIRVVTADEGGPVTVGRAALRTLMWAILAVPAGLGLLTACFRSDHRGIHDRFAGTRVVRASS